MLSGSSSTTLCAPVSRSAYSLVGVGGPCVFWPGSFDGVKMAVSQQLVSEMWVEPNTHTQLQGSNN